MKTIKLLSVLLAMTFMLGASAQAQTVKKKSAYPIWSISPMGGIAFPVGKFGESFKSGPTFGLDVNYKANKEVGFFVELAYDIFTTKTEGATDGKYIEYTAGPRYYFTSKNLKSAFFLEAGLGGYSFRQNEYTVTVNGTPTNFPEFNSTKFGINVGLGALLNLGKTVDLKMKAKYHNILTSDGSTSFIAPVLGIDIRL
ncbi:MAG: outer membrane beta-barrel protein [Ignavibacteria bacterium]|nr:outer membrane beta-barrel protein [Ignavibacteria bacterium]